MKVRDVMGAEVITIPSTATYEDAAKMVYKYRLSGLPVVDPKGSLVGMISEKDLFKALYPRYEDFAADPEAYKNHETGEDEIENIRKQPLEKFMSRKVFTIGPDASILSAGGIMIAHGIHRLPVVENGKLIGIVIREDIYSAILKHHLDLK